MNSDLSTFLSSESAFDKHISSDIEIRLQPLKAKNLIAADANGFSDPYCIVKVLDETGSVVSEYQTNACKKTLNPIWCENQPSEQWFYLTHNISKKKLQLWKIQFLIRDKDKIGYDDSIGYVELSIDDLCRNKRGWYKLSAPKYESKHKRRGISENKWNKMFLNKNFGEIEIAFKITAGGVPLQHLDLVNDISNVKTSIS